MQQQQQQCSFASVVPSAGTAAGTLLLKISCCCGGHDVSHTAAVAVDTTLSGNKLQFLSTYSQPNCRYISGQIGRRRSTVFAFLMPCWYSYSHHNNRCIFGHRDITCLRSSKRTLKPSKTKYPLGKHPNNLMTYKINPRYGIGALCIVLLSTTNTPPAHYTRPKHFPPFSVHDSKTERRYMANHHELISNSEI